MNFSHQEEGYQEAHERRCAQGQEAVHKATTLQ